jgi:hypothetical protein
MAECHVTQSTTEGQLAAARALAGFGIQELATFADIVLRALHRLGTGGVICVSEKKRHGHMQRAVWDRIMAALATAGVELLAEGGSFGTGCAGRSHLSGDKSIRRDEPGKGRRPTLGTRCARSQCQRLARRSSWSCSRDLFILGATS